MRQRDNKIIIDKLMGDAPGVGDVHRRFHAGSEVIGAP